MKRKSLLFLSAAALLSCSNPQRVPGPIGMPGPPPEEVELAVAGPETIVVRHASPVWIIRPGSTAGYPLPYHRKRERVASGGTIRVGHGGRAELLWPGDATSIVLFEEARVQLGDPARDEPNISFHEMTRAQLTLTPEDRIVLLGGAELRGDAVQPSGPFLLEKIKPRLLRVRNQSKLRGRLLYRDTVLELAPGDSIDLPVLSIGTTPVELDPGRSQETGGGIAYDVVGRVTPDPGDRAVLLRALELSEVDAQGVQVRLARDDEAVFSTLGGKAPRE